MSETMEIPLMNRAGRVVGRAIVDRHMTRLLTRPWCLTAGYPSTRLRIGGELRTVYMHRVILGLLATEGDVRVDHINGDPCDNRLCNLRVTDASGNGQNRLGLSPRSTTGFRGVYLDKQSGRYLAYAIHRGRRHYAGFYDTAKEAGEAAAELRRKLGFLEGAWRDSTSSTAPTTAPETPCCIAG